MPSPVMLFGALLEVIYPERCLLCGIDHGSVPWSARGVRIPGMRFWDGTHLCLDCLAGLEAGIFRGRAGDRHGLNLPVVAAAPTNPCLVKLVGQYKYHGLRGLAWPLAGLLRRPLAEAQAKYGGVDALVPMALHSRRRRVRGFNQAEILARLVTVGTGLSVLNRALVRHRNTGQQAKITCARERLRNVTAAFRAAGPGGFDLGPKGGRNRVGLVDDLVTTGWTVAAAAGALRAAGWDVRWVLALGQATDGKNNSLRVDTWEGGF